MKQPQTIPRWLKRLDLAKAELKSWRFPRTAEEGLRQCAKLSAASLKIFHATTRNKTNPDRLLAKLRQSESLLTPVWKRDCARFFSR